MTAAAPRFSVVIPCYGHERYIPALVESLWAQRFRDFEIVAVDDGSPDGSKAVLEGLASRSEIPFRVIATPNRGAHAALNLGWMNAVGEFVAFANDDDTFHPDRLDVFDRVTRQLPNFAWGFSGVQPIDEHGVPIEIQQIPDLTRQLAIHLSANPLEATAAIPRRNATVSSGNLVVRRDLIANVGGFSDFRFTHDWDLVLRLLEVAAPYVSERRLYSYRVHLGNAFAAQRGGDGARVADAEAQVIIRAQVHRERVRASFEPVVTGSAELDPDEAFAIKSTLWAVRKLRSVPILYSTVRAAARRARKLRTR